jgi:hypothetical protein
VAILVALLVAIGVGVRLRYLDEGPLFIDEGESALNAFSILEHGVPRDRVLGMPLFENTLTEPWPGSAEFEFRDTSYSPRGLAAYHGWLPLYAIAASLHLHGIRPGELSGVADVPDRIRAARLPSVAFAAVFLVFLFLAGRTLLGVDAGLSALAVGALAPKCVWIAQQARYHSAALALTVCGAWAVWRIRKGGRRRDFVIAGIAGALLFHTSSLSFALLALAGLPLVPGMLRSPGGVRNAALAAGVLAAAVVPWLLWTGYLDAVARAPLARDLLAFPEDYAAYALRRVDRVIAGGAALALFLGAYLLRRRLPARLGRDMDAAAAPLGFLLVWLTTAYVGFQALVPAASAWGERLGNAMLAPLILLGSVGVALAARAVAPRQAPWSAPLVTLAALLASGNAFWWQHRDPWEARAVEEAVQRVRELDRELAADARLYALSSQHLCLTYLSGVPVQTVLPVRRSFLDAHPGEVVILETVQRPHRPSLQLVRGLASKRGVDLSDEEAERWQRALNAHLAREAVAPRVRSVGSVPPLPAGAEPVLRDLARVCADESYGVHPFSQDNPAMFRGQPPMTIADFWPAFFYRFVGPEGRVGEHMNHAGRARSARAEVLGSGWVVLRCPPPDRLASEVPR